MCDKKIDNEYQRKILTKIIDSSSKLIIFKNCRNTLLDNLLGVKYEGNFYISKGNLYYIRVNNDNPIIEFFDKELRYVPLINAELSKVDCNQITLLEIENSLSKTHICFTPPNILYIPYSLEDYFKDKPYYYSLILEKFLTET